MNILLRPLDCLRGFSQRNSGRQIKRQGDHRELPLVIDCQSRVRSLEMTEGSEWNLAPAIGVHVNAFERIWILRKLRIHFEHHVILVQLRKYGGHLALSEGVVKRIVDGLGQYAQTRRGVAIDHQFCFKSAILLVGGHVAHGRQLTQFVHQFGRPQRQLL